MKKDKSIINQLKIKSIFFLCSNKTSLYGMQNLAERSQKYNSNPILLTYSNTKINTIIRVIRLKKSSNNFINFHLIDKISNSRIKNILPIYIKNLIKKLYFNLEKSLWTNSFYKNVNELENILKEENAEAGFIYGDRHRGYEPSFIKACKNLSIPLIIVPIAVSSTKNSIMKSRYMKGKLLNYFDISQDTDFKKRFPKHWISDNNNEVSFYPNRLTIYLDEVGILTDNPWVMGCGKSDILCAESIYWSKQYISKGVNKEKIVLTGSPEYDNLYECFKNKESVNKYIKEKYNLSNKKILLISLPQLLEHKLADAKTHWQVQNDLCGSAEINDWTILVSLHPKMNKDRYLYLEKKFGVIIVDEKLRDILSIADLYLVGQGSTTIEWAMLTEIPTLIADWYGLNYKTFDWIKGKIIFKSPLELREKIKEIANNTQFLKDMKEAHINQKSNNSLFDGKCLKRVINSYKHFNK